jgi:hypothetical protein
MGWFEGHIQQAIKDQVTPSLSLFHQGKLPSCDKKAAIVPNITPRYCPIQD